MPKKKKKSPNTLKTTRPDYADHTFRSFPTWPRPLSLSPGPIVIHGAACGILEAQAIAAAYSGCVLPVRIVQTLEVLA